MPKKRDDARRTSELCGQAAFEAARVVDRVMRDERASCLCVEGCGGTGKSTVLDSCFAARGCDVFRWNDDCGSGAHSTHAVAAKKSLLSFVMPGGEDEGGTGSTSNMDKEKKEERPDEPMRPVVLLADNVHDTFAENRTTIQMLAKKAATITKKDGGGAGSRRGRPVHLVVTYDPSKLESRILAQIRGIASPTPPVSMRHPDAAETLAFVKRALKEEENEIKKGGADVIDALEPADVDTTGGVALAFREARKRVRQFRREVEGKGGQMDEEDACEISRAEDRLWDTRFSYTGHKCDSLVGCLRRSALRLDVPEQAERATRVAHALFLANVMVGGTKTEFDGDGLRGTASALCEIASLMC